MKTFLCIPFKIWLVSIIELQCALSKFYILLLFFMIPPRNLKLPQFYTILRQSHQLHIHSLLYCFFSISAFPAIFKLFFLFFTFCLVKDQFHNSKLKVNNVIFVLGIRFPNVSVWIVMHSVVENCVKFICF